MTVPIEYTDIRTDNVVDSNSRYANRKIIYYGDKRLLTFETYIRQPYKFNGKEKVMLINKGVEYRPDLVSYDVYGIPDFWWRILEANNMYDIWDFKVGTTIQLPNLFN